MSRSHDTLGRVFETLQEEGLVGSDWAARVLAEADLRPPQPWFVRAMVAFGAWLGSLLLIVAIVGMSVASTGGGYALLGLIFLVVSVVLHRTTDRDFTRHATIATSLAGQVLLAVGMADAGFFDDVDAFLLTLILANAILIRVLPDRIHRFLSVLFIVASTVGLVYSWEVQVVLPFIGPLLAYGVLILMREETGIVSRGLDEISTPVMAGMLVSALGCLMLSTLYVLPEIARDFTFYPLPWISTLLLGGILLYVQRNIWSAIFGDASGRAAVAAYAVTALVIVAALPAPGIVMALLVMSLGLLHGNPLYAGIGVVFLAVFTGTYFYGIDLTMLTKSGTLVASGGAILLARRVLLSLVEPSRGGTGA